MAANGKEGSLGGRSESRSAIKSLTRFLQHVLPRGHQRVRHYEILSRASQVNFDLLRATILKFIADSEPDLELVDWTVPQLRSSVDAGPKCPTCGEPMTFESFIRIRPPPLQGRGRNSV